MRKYKQFVDIVAFLNTFLASIYNATMLICTLNRGIFNEFFLLSYQVLKAQIRVWSWYQFFK